MESYIGKKVTVDLEELSTTLRDLGWDSYGDLEGSGSLYISTHPYRDSFSYSFDDDDGADEEESDISVSISLYFETDASGVITKVERCADCYCVGDSGLGECDPDDVWEVSDEIAATAFLASITN